MAYFPNGTSAEIYQARYCNRCIHDANQDCPILALHMVHNYDQCNEPHSFLNVLIPRDKETGENQECRMFIAAQAIGEKVGKGEYGQECNRTACSNSPATWANHGMPNRFYCEPCAKLINANNREIQPPLCSPADMSEAEIERQAGRNE